VLSIEPPEGMANLKVFAHCTKVLVGGGGRRRRRKRRGWWW